MDKGQATTVDRRHVETGCRALSAGRIQAVTDKMYYTYAYIKIFADSFFPGRARSKAFNFRILVASNSVVPLVEKEK